uniref:Uncharacterized protein n=1 Tax=Magallana gigas TaxID=29159 RepID=A0A8W8MKD9_MAGGI
MIAGPGCRPVEHYAHFCFENNVKEIILLDTSEKPLYCAVQDAYGLAVSAVVMVLLLLLGWILRSILSHFGIKCRVPVRRGEGGGVMSKTPSHGTRKPAPKSVYVQKLT